MIQKILIYTSQLIMTTIVKSWLLIIRRLIKISSPNKPFHISKRYVYVANHASFLDPLVMWSVLSIQQRLHGAPTKVMTSPHIYYGPLRPFIWFLGAYPAKKKRGKHVHSGVEGSLYYLRNGYNICIFPEGKRSLQSEKRAFNGVSRILAEVDEFEMILIKITWGQGPWWKRTLKLSAEKAPSAMDHHNPEAIMERIYNL